MSNPQNPPNPYNIKINLNHQATPGTPVKPLASLAGMRYCTHGGGHTVDESQFVSVMRFNPGTNEMVYAGCYDCLRRMQEAAHTPPLNEGIKALLQRCREQIMDSDWKRVDALVADIDAALKGK